MQKCFLYNNQINAHALICQSAMVYGAGKLMEKIVRLLNYYLKAIDQRLLYKSYRPLKEFVNHEPAAHEIGEYPRNWGISEISMYHTSE